jgi:hypothetical protein
MVNHSLKNKEKLQQVNKTTPSKLFHLKDLGRNSFKTSGRIHKTSCSY